MAAEHGAWVGRVAHLQHALFHRHGAAERLVAGQQQRACALLDQRTGAAQGAAELAIGALGKQQPRVVEDPATQAGGGARQRTATDGSAAGVGIRASQQQGTGIQFVDAAGPHQRSINLSGHAGIDPHWRQAAIRRIGRAQAAPSAGRQGVTGVKELQAGKALVTDNRHGAALPAKYRELVGGRLPLGAGRVSPVGARAPGTTATGNGAIGVGGAAVPELDLPWRGLHHQVELVGQRRLQAQVAQCHRQGAKGEAVIGQAAAVAEQLVHADTEAAGIADVEGAVQGQVARHVHRCTGGTRRTEGEVQGGAR